jgi:ribosomal protein L37E
MPHLTYRLIDAPTALRGVAIQCLRCGRTSYNPRDVEELYCGHCHIFHDLEAIRAEAEALAQQDEARRKRLGLEDTPC